MSEQLQRACELFEAGQKAIRSLAKEDIQQALHDNGYELIIVHDSEFVKVDVTGFTEACIYDVTFSDEALNANKKRQHVFIWYSLLDKAIIAHL